MYNNDYQYYQSNELILSKDKDIAKNAINRILNRCQNIYLHQDFPSAKIALLKWYQELLTTLDEYFYNTKKFREYKNHIISIFNDYCSIQSYSNYPSVGIDKSIYDNQQIAKIKEDVDYIVNIVGAMKEAAGIADEPVGNNSSIVTSNVEISNVAERKQPSSSALTKNQNNKKVFIVHGHNDAMKEAVARFIEKIKLEAVILSEQANQGNTIIEKFEANTDVGYAIILCSADDIGYPRGKPEQAKSRARQNVVFELGYFVAKLGRSKVAMLIENPDNFEYPSDIAGIVYIDYKTIDACGLRIVKELKAAGYEINAEDMFK